MQHLAPLASPQGVLVVSISRPESLALGQGSIPCIAAQQGGGGEGAVGTESKAGQGMREEYIDPDRLDRRFNTEKVRIK